MIKAIIRADKKSLREKSKPVKEVDKKIRELITNLRDTLAAQKDPEGVGLAAPQIGKNLRVFVMFSGDKIRAVINPEILEVSKGKKKKRITKNSPMEGCLSIPHFYGPLVRAEKIKLQYLDEEGKWLTRTFEGFDAQVVQHEIDHLEGILFVDRIFENNLPLYEYKDGEWVKSDL